MQFKFSAYGHENIRATHENTVEFTKEGNLTPKGDCIVAVRAEKALKDLPEALKEKLRAGSEIRIDIECGGEKETITAHGHSELTFKSDECMIIRKSDFICDRTLGVRADKAASDLNRKLVGKLQKGLSARITLNV